MNTPYGLISHHRGTMSDAAGKTPAFNLIYFELTPELQHLGKNGFKTVYENF